MIRMLFPSRTFTIALLLGIVATPTTSLHAQGDRGEEILRRVERSLDGLRDYVVTIETSVDMEQLRMPRMKAQMYYKRPNKLHIDSDRFMMLPREGLLMDPARLLKEYTVTFAGMTEIEGRKVAHLQLAANSVKTRLRQLDLWVDTELNTIVKMGSVPYQGRLMTATFRYELQEGAFWMPVSMVAEFQRTADVRNDSDSSLPKETVDKYAPLYGELQRAPRRGTITVLFSDYRINIGLDDTIFEKKEEDR